MSTSGAAGWRDPEPPPAAPLGSRAPGLLRDALAYADEVLRTVPARGSGAPRLPTPCEGWDLDRLLAHLEDGLDAFTEAARGAVRVEPPYPVGRSDAAGRPARLRRKTHRLARAWARGCPAEVRLGEQTLATDLLVPAAALEVAVHAWDVAWALRTGAPPALDPRLGRALAPAAALLVPRGPARAGRFDEPPPWLEGPEEDLLAWLGRDAAGLRVGTLRRPAG